MNTVKSFLWLTPYTNEQYVIKTPFELQLIYFFLIVLLSSGSYFIPCSYKCE